MIPPPILTQHTVLLCCLFEALLQTTSMVLAYYVPFYFQSVKGLSAEASGLQTLAQGISIFLSTLLTGSLITLLGFYVPFLWIGSAVLAVGSGLMFSLKVGSGVGEWLSYQIVTGVGYGGAVQVPFFAVSHSYWP